MKSKEELKKLFENGDVPKQEDFWEWQDSYVHKEEKIPSEQINYDFSKKADLVDGKIPSDQLPNIIESFDTIVNRENSTTKNEIILASTKGRLAALGFNEATEGYYFGDMNPTHTGNNNIGMGTNTLKKITSGSYNTSIGCYSLSEITEGNSNVTIGYATAYKLNKSTSNVFIGHYSGFNLSSEVSESDITNISPAAAAYMKEQPTLSGYNGTTFSSSLNTYVGGAINANGSTPSRAAMSTIIGASTLNNVLYRNFNNIIIGAGNYIKTANSSMNNSIIIGNCINLPNQVDALAIGLDKSRRINFNEAIIYGELPNNKLTINAPLRVTGGVTLPALSNATEDIAYTKTIVSKDDGTLGFRNNNRVNTTITTSYGNIDISKKDDNVYLKGILDLDATYIPRSEIGTLLLDYSDTAEHYLQVFTINHLDGIKNSGVLTIKEQSIFYEGEIPEGGLSIVLRSEFTLIK